MTAAAITELRVMVEHLRAEGKAARLGALMSRKVTVKMPKRRKPRRPPLPAKE